MADGTFISEMLDFLSSNSHLLKVERGGGPRVQVRRTHLPLNVTLTIKKNPDRLYATLTIHIEGVSREFACDYKSVNAILDAASGRYAMHQAELQDQATLEIKSAKKQIQAANDRVQEMQGRIDSLESAIGSFLRKQSPKAINDSWDCTELLNELAGGEYSTPLCECPVCGKHVHLQSADWCYDSRCSLPDKHCCEHVAFTGHIGGNDEDCFECEGVDISDLSDEVLMLSNEVNCHISDTDSEDDRIEALINEKVSDRLRLLIEDDSPLDYTESLLESDPDYAGSVSVDYCSGGMGGGQCWDIAFTRNAVKSQKYLIDELKQDVKILKMILASIGS